MILDEGYLLFAAITYGKVSLWLWKSLENSGNFFLLLCGHPVILLARHPLSVVQTAELLLLCQMFVSI